MWDVNLLVSSYSWTFVNIYFWHYEIKSPISSKLWIFKVAALDETIIPSCFLFSIQNIEQ